MDIPRRTFIQHSMLCLGGLLGAAQADEPTQQPVLRIGLLTDLHYADKPPRGNRVYREAAAKLQEAVEIFNEHALQFVVCLGDLIDKASSVEVEIGWLKHIESIFAKTKAPRHYVLGNHCVATLTKDEFRTHTAASKTSHYSFDAGDFHFVVLDACFTADGTPYGRDNFDWKDANIPQSQVDWLGADLAASSKPVLVFAHQRLDEAGALSVRNAATVRKVLESSGRVMAVFQGHSHRNEYQQIAGIHYCTLVAMIEGAGPENSGYALLEVMADRSLRLRGFRRQVARDWGAK